MSFQELSEIFASKFLAFIALWPEIKDDYAVTESLNLNDWYKLKMYATQFNLLSLTAYAENRLVELANQEISNLEDLDDFVYLHFLLGFLDEKEKPSVINKMAKLAESIEEKMIVFNLDPSEDNAQSALDCSQSFEDDLFIMENDDTGSRFTNLEMIDRMQKWPGKSFPQAMDLYEQAMILGHHNPISLIESDLKVLTDTCEEWLARFNEEKNSYDYTLAQVFFEQILKTAKDTKHFLKAYFYTRVYCRHAQNESQVELSKKMHDEIKSILRQWLLSNPEKIQETLAPGISTDDSIKKWILQEIQKIARNGILDPADQAAEILKGFADQT